jgi:hypothetical protein
MRSRDQLKAHLLMYHHLLPSPDPSVVSNGASTKSLAFWRSANRDHRQFAQNRLHRYNVNHLINSLALIHKTGSAVQQPVCKKLDKLD